MSRRPKVPHGGVKAPGAAVRPPMPPWLCDPTPPKNKNQRDSRRYYTNLYWATPPWLSAEQRKAIADFYARAGGGRQVDHIVPLNSYAVCGLHVPWNLQLLPPGLNARKANHTWPDCPHEIEPLFDPTPEPYQLRLPL